MKKKHSKFLLKEVFKGIPTKSCETVQSLAFFCNKYMQNTVLSLHFGCQIYGIKL